MLPWSVIPRAGCPSATAACDQVLDPGGTVEHRELGVGVQVGERPCGQRAGAFLGVSSRVVVRGLSTGCGRVTAL